MSDTGYRVLPAGCVFATKLLSATHAGSLSVAACQRTCERVYFVCLCVHVRVVCYVYVLLCRRVLCYCVVSCVLLVSKRASEGARECVRERERDEVCKPVCLRAACACVRA